MPAADSDFLAEMLVAVASWRLEDPVGSIAEVLSQPQLAHYVPDNDACRLYERVDFRQVYQVGSSLTMLLRPQSPSWLSFGDEPAKCQRPLRVCEWPSCVIALTPVHFPRFTNMTTGSYMGTSEE